MVLEYRAILDFPQQEREEVAMTPKSLRQAKLQPDHRHQTNTTLLEWYIAFYKAQRSSCRPTKSVRALKIKLRIIKLIEFLQRYVVVTSEVLGTCVCVCVNDLPRVDARQCSLGIETSSVKSPKADARPTQHIVHKHVAETQLISKQCRVQIVSVLMTNGLILKTSQGKLRLKIFLRKT